jgi:DNA-binding MarR family transcriptional regulator
MSSQVLSEQSSAVRAFLGLVRSHAAVTRRLSAELTNDHGLTINDYEVLLRLSRSPDRRMRRVDLAGEVLLTPSGITRLLDGLERAGFVERGTCASDRRVVYAVLTDAGLAKVREASTSHVAQIDELFEARLDAAELETVGDLLVRLGEAAADEDCRPPQEEG